MTCPPKKWGHQFLTDKKLKHILDLVDKFEAVYDYPENLFWDYQMMTRFQRKGKGF